MFEAIGMEIVKTRGYVGQDVRWIAKTRGFVGLDVGGSGKIRGFVGPGVWRFGGPRNLSPHAPRTNFRLDVRWRQYGNPEW